MAGVYRDLPSFIAKPTIRRRYVRFLLDLPYDSSAFEMPEFVSYACVQDVDTDSSRAYLECKSIKSAEFVRDRLRAEFVKPLIHVSRQDTYRNSFNATAKVKEFGVPSRRDSVTVKS